MEAKATAKMIRIAPRKARLTLDLVRGKSVSDANAILSNLNTRASRIITKVLVSATANAVNNLGMDDQLLIVKEAYINEGPTLKRIRPVARGQAHRILKRTSHITLVVGDKK